ncbi:MAG: HAD family phosphatase [Coriobacteriaceae bacterium]|nr:MAG: HAD family phosphatase [Coriobacteriaceae bacterium]
MHDYRLLALDMDGTLLNSKKQVSPATAQALRGLTDAGGFATIATGRGYREIVPLLHDLAPVRYAVLGNGSVVMDLWERRVVSETTIPNHGAIDAVRAGLASGCLVNILTSTGAYFNMADVERAPEVGLGQYQSLWEQVNEQMDDPIAFLQDHPNKAVKINLYHFTQEGRVRTREALRGANVQVAFAEGASVEITAPGVRKDSGIARLCDELGLDLSQVVAVGDGGNDLDMLRNCGLGVAMANATPAALEASDVVTQADCDHDGVAEVIGRYF